MPKIFSALALSAGFAVATSASAQIDAINIVDNGGGGQDVLVDFQNQYTGSQILIELTEGEIILGAGLFPTTVRGLDSTFLTSNQNPLPIDSLTGAFELPAISGGAVDLLNGDGPAVATSTTLSVAYNVSTVQQGPANQDQTSFLTARVALSGDAQGSFAYLASAGITEGSPTEVRFDIVDGTIVVPEPTSAALLGLAGLGLIARRRKTA